MTAVIIGIGNEYRRDDGVGPALVAAIEPCLPDGVRAVLCDGEPAALLDTWAGVPLAIVVDAVQCEPSSPGTIHRYETGEVPGHPGSASTHALGVPDALRLAQALDRVPDRLVVYAVEAADVGFGTGLSDPVQLAFPELVEAVLAEVR
ncbi:hydrogenase maturation protease [Kribbella sindirgiensis]|uniref:Hydrogenase maturation protease n=1 Tax=Kribbella sindirgiensis TaxID=1124744 RepID=A0A4R0I1K0_9ACTN|nr:hydrogenase maturation protease [Kribbella sindirgiensis]TCC21577.1 hydrogenase maturation protease [Kribbella sindirgiensis]